MKHKTFFFILSVTFLYTVFSLLNTSVLAQSPAPSSPATGLAVTPPTFEINANPGEKISNTVKLQNLHPYSVEIAVDRRNFTAIGEEGAVGLTEEETNFSLASWIEVTPSTLTLPPKSSQFFNFTISVPLTAEPGGHFGSLIFRTIPTEKIEGSGASLATEIGSLVLLRVAGETLELASIESFTTSKSIYEHGPVGFVLRMQNQGNVHTKPVGRVSITNLFGSQVASFEVPPKNILPGATRRLDATWDTLYHLGRYQATVTTTLGDGSTRSAVTTFWLLPYRLILIILIILLILVLLLRRYRTRLALAWKILTSGKA